MNLYEHLEKPPMDSERCPACGGIGSVVKHDEFLYVCNLCGAPRIPLPPGLGAPQALESLRKAEQGRRNRAKGIAAKALGGVGLAGNLLLFLAFALVFSVTTALVIAAFLGAPFVAALLWGISKQKQGSAEIPRHLDAAWELAAREVVKAGKATTPAALAQTLGIDLPRAEQLFAMMTVDALVSDPVAERVRIETAGTVALPPDPRFEALERKAREASSAEAEAHAEVEAALSDAQEGGVRVAHKDEP